ncbi:MAG TPA: roadblock/LC7 domain-containing protein [Desulfuromonadales bacterium]|nr:roadblock/LC7 domain-containing protein [Desulfuromonadales bacterium]
MQDILQHINSVEGVIGTAVFSQKGDLLVHAFPALIDVPALKKSAALMLECSYGLQISQTLELLDLRYSGGRIVVKTFSGSMLFLLCASTINLQVLTISLNLAAKKLEGLLCNAPDTELSAASSVGTDAFLQTDGILRMRISHLVKKEASASFDSLGMIALSQPTYQYISDYYKSPFKKLMLTNSATAVNGSFAVMVMKDMDQQYDGTIIVGPGIEKKLKVNEGDKVEIRVG